MLQLCSRRRLTPETVLIAEIFCVQIFSMSTSVTERLPVKSQSCVTCRLLLRLKIQSYKTQSRSVS